MKIGIGKTYALGALFGVLVWLIVSATLADFGATASFLMGLISGVGTFLFGFDTGKTIPIGHEGVLTIMGKKLPVVVTEGKTWLLPFLMDFVIIDVREKNEVIGEDGKLRVLALAKDGETSIELSVKMLVRYKVVKSLEFVNQDGPTIIKNIVELAKAALRQVAGSRDYLYFINEVENADKDIGDIFFPNIEQKNVGWGIDILECTLVKAIPADPEFIQAMQKSAQEEKETEGEVKEIEHSIAQIKRLAKELGISTEEAAIFFQVERGKAKRTHYSGLEGSRPIIDPNN